MSDRGSNGNARGKIRPALAEEASGHSDADGLEVIVELLALEMPDRPTRRERVDALKAAYEEEAGGLRLKISEAGGTVVDEAWLNQTMRTVLPKGALLRIAAEDVVVGMDRPRGLTVDQGSDEADEPGAL